MVGVSVTMSGGGGSEDEDEIHFRRRGRAPSPTDPTQKVTSPSHSAHSYLLRTSLIKISEEKKAKRVCFYRNGDRFFKGLVYAIAPDKHRSFDSLLAELTRVLDDKVSLPSGVRYILTLAGKKVTKLDEIESGQSYVCSSTEVFKKLDYGKVGGGGGNPKRTTTSKGGKATTNSTGFSTTNNNNTTATTTPRNGETTDSTKDFIKPKLVTIIRNGIRPRKTVRMLLNRKTARSFEQVLDDITEAIKLDTGAVRKVFTVDGAQVTCLADFFQNDDVFIAYGPEKYSHDDFDLDSDECRLIQSQSKSASSTLRRHRRSLLVVPEKRRSRVSPTDTPTDDGRERVSRASSPRTARKQLTKSRQKVKREQLENGFDDFEPVFLCPEAISRKYKMGKVIGDGSFAVVRECWCRKSGSGFALKIIDKLKCRGEEEMIESEVSILRRVRHPNIVQLYEEFHYSDKLYLVMELVKGGDLFDSIAAMSRYSELEASGFVRDLASALQYLHSLNIVHRDIKPENLLVLTSPSGRSTLKLADFGLAQEVLEPLYTVCGTPTYVAPEILAETGYSLEVDIWAMGVITYILLCGFPPFSSPDNNQEELFEQILQGRYSFPTPYWDDISDEAREVIYQMLKVDPSHRCTAKQILQHPWITLSAVAEQLRTGQQGRATSQRNSSLLTPHSPIRPTSPSLSYQPDSLSSDTVF